MWTVFKFWSNAKRDSLCTFAASMCVECCRRSLEEGLSEAAHSNRSPTAPRADSIIPKQESFIGALSYHKPSIISRSSASSPSGSSDELGAESLNSNDQDTADNKKKAIACPGGTYFPSAIEDTSSFKDTDADESVVKDIDGGDLSQAFYDCACVSDAEIEVNGQDVVSYDKHYIRSAGHHCIADVSLTKSPTSSSNTDYDAKLAGDTPQPALDSTNLYTILCGRDTADVVDNLSGSAYDDSSDNADSCESSSGESGISPRQGSLVRVGGTGDAAPVRRAPSTRYKKMRRRLKRLITRSRPCAEVARREEYVTRAEREEQFLSVGVPDFLGNFCRSWLFS